MIIKYTLLESTGAVKACEKCRCKQMHSYLEEISCKTVLEISGKIGINFQKKISGLTTLTYVIVSYVIVYCLLKA